MHRLSRANELLRLLDDGKDVLVGAIDVATDAVETPIALPRYLGKRQNTVRRTRLSAARIAHGADAPRHCDGQARGPARGAALARRKFA